MLKKISGAGIKKVVAKCFSEDIVKVRPYSTGYINSPYEIRLKDGREIMLRVFNEAWKARKEDFVYDLIRKKCDVPVPDVYVCDDSKRILPAAYLLMSKVKGRQIDEDYRKYGNKKLFEKAGEMLAKIHSIKFSRYGWIVGKEIKPSFHNWEDFVWHDIGFKLGNLKDVKRVKQLGPEIEAYIDAGTGLLDIKMRPCLLHKDYHCPHIITDKDDINGIIDVEWAISGHNENDFMKMELLAFGRIKGVRESFFNGYSKYGSISDEYAERKKLYELWHLLSMVNISYELKNKERLDSNIKRLERFLGK